MQTCLFASDQTYSDWDWIQFSYSSAFNFGSRRAMFAMNCNSAIHGSEVCFVFPCFAQRWLCSTYRVSSHAQSSWQLYPSMCALGTMKEQKFPSMVLCYSSSTLVWPSSSSRFSLPPWFIFLPFFHVLSLFKPLVRHCHRPVMVFLSQALLQPCWLSPGLSDPDSVAALAVPCTSSQSSHLHHTSSPAPTASLAQRTPPSCPLLPSSYPIHSPPGPLWMHQDAHRHNWVSLNLYPRMALSGPEME